jgi:hypothetical protein
MKGWLFVLAMLPLVIAADVRAGPHDGSWSGESDTGACIERFTLSLIVTDGRITGTAHTDRSRMHDVRWAVSGTVGADRKVMLRLDTDDPRVQRPRNIVVWRGEVEGARMTLAQLPNTCERKVTLTRL